MLAHAQKYFTATLAMAILPSLLFSTSMLSTIILPASTSFYAALVLLARATQWSRVECLPDGAPSFACGTYSPQEVFHSNISNGRFGVIPIYSQTTPVPYEVDLSSLDDGSGVLFYVPGAAYSCMKTVYVAARCIILAMGL